jgi:hypothetical protein
MASVRIPAMRSLSNVRPLVGICCLAFAGLFIVTTVAAAGPRPAAPTNRTVYVTITDDKNVGVSDLTPADLVVKEGGKEREIVKIERASAKMRLSLAVEERLIPDTQLRIALFDFMKRVIDGAEIRLITVGLRNNTVVDYTSSLDTLVGALNKFTLNPQKESAIAESVLQMSEEFIAQKPERPVMVLVCTTGGQAGVEAKHVLEKLRDSGATMFVAAWLAGGSAVGPVGSMGEMSGREQVIGDGPKQSGGRRADFSGTAGTSKALLQVANDLQSQYAITYALPDGVKPDRRFGLTVKRRGLTVRAPTAIPEK